MRRRRDRKITTISARVRIINPGRPIWSKKPVLGMGPPVAGVVFAAGTTFPMAVEVICAANWVCMATKVAGSVVGVTVPVAVGIAITAVGLLTSALVGTLVFVGVLLGSGVGVQRAAWAVEVICATTCALPAWMAAWVAFCEAV